MCLKAHGCMITYSEQVLEGYFFMSATYEFECKFKGIFMLLMFYPVVLLVHFCQISHFLVCLGCFLVSTTFILWSVILSLFFFLDDPDNSALFFLLAGDDVKEKKPDPSIYQTATRVVETIT